MASPARTMLEEREHESRLHFYYAAKSKLGFLFRCSSLKTLGTSLRSVKIHRGEHFYLLKSQILRWVFPENEKMIIARIYFRMYALCTNFVFGKSLVFNVKIYLH